MKISKIGSVTLLSVVMLGTSGTQVFAWENGVEDPNTTYQDVTKTDSATVEVNGEIKEFDPTDPNGPDPEDPKNWIDVSVPISTNFVQTEATSGVVAPSYKVTNYSAKGVKVSINDFVDKKPVESAKVPELKLNIMAGSTVIPLVDAGKPALVKSELGILNKTNDSFNFTYTGEVGSSFKFDKTAVTPTYDLILQLEALV